MNWYVFIPAIVLVFGSGVFAIRAFWLLFKMFQDSPARYRELSPEEGLYYLLIRPTQNRQFMTNVFLGMIILLAGLILLAISLKGGNP